MSFDRRACSSRTSDADICLFAAGSGVEAAGERFVGWRVPARSSPGGRRGLEPERASSAGRGLDGRGVRVHGVRSDPSRGGRRRSSHLARPRLKAPQYFNPVYFTKVKSNDRSAASRASSTTMASDSPLEHLASAVPEVYDQILDRLTPTAKSFLAASSPVCRAAHKRRRPPHQRLPAFRTADLLCSLGTVRWAQARGWSPDTPLRPMRASTRPGGPVAHVIGAIGAPVEVVRAFRPATATFGFDKTCVCAAAAYGHASVLAYLLDEKKPKTARRDDAHDSFHVPGVDVSHLPFSHRLDLLVAVRSRPADQVGSRLALARVLFDETSEWKRFGVSSSCRRRPEGARSARCDGASFC